MKTAVALAIVACSLAATALAQEVKNFTYHSPGIIEREGNTGVSARRIHYSDFTFPVIFDPSKQIVVLNSQMYRPGGICHHGSCGTWDGGKEGDRCEASNYDYPWVDTFCELAGRTYATNACPNKKGHQGLDIRLPTPVKGDKSQYCRPGTWWSASPVDGEVISRTGAVVRIRDNQHRFIVVFRHMVPSSLAHLKPGDSVKAGDKIGLISGYNNQGTKLYTPPHLHMEVLRNDARQDYIPAYTSMIVAYRKKLGLSNPNLQDLKVDQVRELTSAP